jgi:hypothetical protein
MNAFAWSSADTGQEEPSLVIIATVVWKLGVVALPVWFSSLLVYLTQLVSVVGQTWNVPIPAFAAKAVGKASLCLGFHLCLGSYASHQDFHMRNFLTQQGDSRAGHLSR